MGATYLTLKTTGELHERAQRRGRHRRPGRPGDVRLHDLDPRRPEHGFRPQAHRGPGPDGRDRRRLAAREKAEGWAFTAAAVGIAGTVGALFSELLPPGPDLDHQRRVQPHRANTASPPYTLKVMTVVAVIFFPIVLVYQAWAYHIFRKRLTVPRVGGEGTDVGKASPHHRRDRRRLPRPEPRGVV